MNITKTNIKRMYQNTIRIGYCELQNLLRFKKADFYTSGVYGWNADIYPININTAIVTGYRPFGTISPNYEIVKKYDQQAQEILKNGKYDYKEKENLVNALLDNFINEVIKQI